MARDARKYRHRIAVYQQSASADGFGGSTLAGSLLANAWAEIQTIPTDKRTDYGLNEVQKSIRVLVRKHGTIDWEAENIYIVYKSTEWDITSVTQTNLWDVEYELIASAR